MASRKKETTGISLLSMYNDEEDEEMDDAESDEEEEVRHDAGGEARRLDNPDLSMGGEDDDVRNKVGNEGTESDHTPQSLKKNSTPVTPQQTQIAVKDQQSGQTASLNIVDYGHDEVAMSPETEDRELHATFRTRADADDGDGLPKEAMEITRAISTSNQVTSPGLPEQNQTPEMAFKDEAFSESQDTESREGKNDTGLTKDVDLLEEFLSSPPEGKCSTKLQDKINKFLNLKRYGKSFNNEVRNKKAYRNPDFLLHAVTYQEIDQIGSCFKKEVFDPHGYDPSDFYDEIEADMKRELERKEQERKTNQKLEFIVGGVQPGMVLSAPKPSLPIQVPNLAAGAPAAVNAVSQESRHNKKSKWDKVDTDQIAQPPVSSVSAGAGSGYTAFAQQRRREAEEKKSSERRRSRS